MASHNLVISEQPSGDRASQRAREAPQFLRRGSSENEVYHRTRQARDCTKYITARKAPERGRCYPHQLNAIGKQSYGCYVDLAGL